MEYVLFVQKVKKDKKGEYVKAHKECWPELLKAIKESGIERLMIWLLENNVLIHTMAEDFDSAMAKLAKRKVFKDWIAKMDPLMDERQDYSGKGNIIGLDKVFDLEAQLKESWNT